MKYTFFLLSILPIIHLFIKSNEHSVESLHTIQENQINKKEELSEVKMHENIDSIDHSNHKNDMQRMHIGHTNHAMHTDHMKNHDKMMHGMYGRYSMNRESSGTSWLPDSSPMEAIHKMYKDWFFMVHGFSYLIYDKQGGKLGGKKVFDENMLMFVAQKNLDDNNIIAFRSMFSIEPLTIGRCGYPLLFQTGETCNGITPLINRQHPHDLFMELAFIYTRIFQDDSSVFFYFGWPGEPALGPPIFIMRFASEYNPEAPLGHHWLDSTHITFGVATLGYVYKKDLKFEISTFKGREPDQHRFDIEALKFDSVALRISYNPTENLALQTSYGFLKSPEQLEPNVNVHRFTLTGIYNKSYEDDYNWQTIFALGINKNEPGKLLPAFLIDSAFEYKKRHLIFTRFETILNNELFIEPDPFAERKFNINKFSLGYIYEFITGHIKWGVGGLIDMFVLPKELDERYGNAFSYMIFLQMRLV